MWVCVRVQARVKVKVKVKVMVMVMGKVMVMVMGGLLPTTSQSTFYSRVDQVPIFSHCQP